MEEKNADLLPTPAAKKNSKFKREYPFPIVTSECKENESDPNWKIAEGYLEGNCVLVHDEECMKRLYCMGFFGKGTLSKNAPRICLQKETTESEKQMPGCATTSSQVEDIIDVVDSDDEDSKSKKLKTSDEDEILICDDSSNNDDCEKVNRSKQSEPEVKESLQLTFQEAYYLSYALGCLLVMDKDKPLNLAVLWTKFCELTPSGNFPVMYTAYHHFRSRGWVVKSGLKYGTDYVLYKDGPPFYHATYSVIVRALKENLKEARGNRVLTWGSMAALNRVNNTAGKEIIFLYVIKPNDMPESIYSTPACVAEFKLEEVLYKRWVASENREENDP
ncbi:tRNA-splicing endonuclease subunit Sen2-like [Argiope bruennichi]|uniref:tRNA-splicing endonuclease subunit Sen2-like n=1 Tax=Argiope bruennichi TaxID=94029 RepID=UPI0024941272|nr:tRNA-splicing endonuclease subunit Sen2-like [Argiope bruennichi]